MSNLSIYLVRYTPVNPAPGNLPDQGEHMALVIAESAVQATNIVAFSADGERYVAHVPEDGVGRLGSYEPGMEGHRMVGSRPPVILLQRI